MAYFRCGSGLPNSVKNLPTLGDAPSGVISSFNTDLTNALNKLKISFSAYQDLSGGNPSPSDPKPFKAFSQANLIRCGKNLLNLSRTNIITSASGSASSIRTFTENDVWVGVTRNNYFDNTRISSYSITANEIVVTNSSAGYGIGLPVRCKPSTTYYLSDSNGNGANIGFYNSEGAYISNSQSANFTTPANCYWVLIVLTGTANNEHTFTNPQLEFGSTPTTYAPYNGNTYLLKFGDTYYGCEIDVVHGKLKVLWGYAEFDGSNDEGWYNYGLTDFHGFRTVISDMKSGTNMFGYCNYLKVQNQANETGVRFGASNNNSLYLFHIYDTIPELNNSSDIADWRTYLSTHVLKVVYPLATPIEVDIDSAIITALTGEVNNVFCDIPTSNVEELQFFETVGRHIQ